MDLIIAEKPSVARDIARVLGVSPRGEGAFRGPSHVITWCIGHLVELDEPASYDPAWKRWSLDTLPMLPERFKLRPSKGTASQWRVVRDLLRSRDFERVVNACDAGREGELIFRYCYELAGSRLPAFRLWISSMTDQALRAGFAQLRPSRDYDPLGDAARCRSEADWLVGLNATRAVTARSRGSGGTLLSLGRVQTPTLALVAARDRAIATFVPRDFFEVWGAFSPSGQGPFKARWAFRGEHRLPTRALGDAISSRVSVCTDAQSARVEKVETKVQREPPPLLFDLTSLQRTANRRFGLSAQRTLDVAQSLYEAHKAITYPRTDSRHLTSDLHREVPSIVQALGQVPDYARFAAQLSAQPIGKPRRVFDDGKVSDHHAIVPTAKVPAEGRLDRDEQRIYDLIVRRFLGAFYPDAESAITRVTILVGPDGKAPPPLDPRPQDGILPDALPPPPDRFEARGKVRLVAGWQEVAGFGDEPPKGEGAAGDEGDELSEQQPLPRLVEGQRLAGAYEVRASQTKPPPRYTEASLLSAMELAGREIDDEALRLAMKERGLGTPATRASTIETLLKRGYLERQKKQVLSTALGRALIEGLPSPKIASAELTGEWEARLSRMARGDGSREAFMRDIERYVRELVGELARGEAAPIAQAARADGPAIGPCPRCGKRVVERFKVFGCEACDFAIYKTIAGRRVSPELAGVLLSRRRTRVLPGFKSKAGKPFSAALELDSSGAVRLAFEGEARAGAAPSPPSAPGGAPRSRPPRTAAAASPAAAPSLSSLRCPRCGEGSMIAGKRAWGCTRWREGCSFVVPFMVGETRLSEAQLVDLVTQGKTRSAPFDVDGKVVKASLVLDVGAEPPAVTLVQSPARKPRDAGKAAPARKPRARRPR